MARKRRRWPSEDESYVCGPGSVPLLGLTVGRLLERAADRFGDREAVVSVAQQRRRATYGRLLDEADRLAGGLRALRLQRGDRVGVWGPNSYEWYLTQWAVARAGLVLVSLLQWST